MALTLCILLLFPKLSEPDDTEALRKSVDILIDADLKFKSVKLNQRVYLEQLIAQLLLTAQEGRR